MKSAIFDLRFPICLAATLAGLTSLPPHATSAPRDERPRVIIETDAGGDPDDEQSLVRFLLYANDLDVVGIIANRPAARDGENRNVERTGLGIVRRQLTAYRECYPNLVQHDARYPTPHQFWQRTVPAYGDTDAGVDLVIKAIDQSDRRPLWFCNWGTDAESSPSCLKQALDRVLKDRGPKGYARFKSKVLLSSADKFDEHTTAIEPPFRLWIDTFRPEVDRKRWYHRFSALTATAGGFNLQRDVLTGHGPLGALYPTNTTHKQKEGDTMAFLYLVPTGMNDPQHPEWGSWGGRYGRNETLPGRPYYWANQQDAWEGTTDRDNTVKRWAAALQNDFRARLDWCVNDRAHANHPPLVSVRGGSERKVRAGAEVTLDSTPSHDPDGQLLRLDWTYYPEPGTYRGEAPTLRPAANGKVTFTAPTVTEPAMLHFIVSATDNGEPPLTRYRRVIVKVRPK